MAQSPIWSGAECVLFAAVNGSKVHKLSRYLMPSWVHSQRSPRWLFVSSFQQPSTARFMTKRCRTESLAVAVTSLLALTAPAQSCTIQKPLRFESIRSGQIVFRAQLINYVHSNSPGETYRQATITFRVIEPLRGKIGEQLVATWRNEGGTPREWRHARDLIVAAVASETGPQILQELCTPAFMIDDSETNLKKVRELLKE